MKNRFIVTSDQVSKVIGVMRLETLNSLGSITCEPEPLRAIISQFLEAL